LHTAYLRTIKDNIRVRIISRNELNCVKYKIADKCNYNVIKYCVEQMSLLNPCKARLRLLIFFSKIDFHASRAAILAKIKKNAPLPIKILNAGANCKKKRSNKK